MDYGYTIIKGIVQGATEFLPVSSTAHLTFTNAFFHMFGWHDEAMRPGEEEFFDILLHLGTLVAVIYYFRNELGLLLKGLFKPAEERATDPETGIPLRSMAAYIVLSMTVTVAFILSMLYGTEWLFTAMGWSRPHMENLSDFYFQYPQFVAFHLLITGGLLFASEKLSQTRITPRPLQAGNAMVIGLFQGFSAIFHGISRSGSTISAALFSGVDRVTATRYSFMLSIPTFILAAVYEGMKVTRLGYIGELNWAPMLVGTVFAGFVGYFCVKYLIQYVASHSLIGFAVYCWCMGTAMLVILSIAGPEVPGL